MPPSSLSDGGIKDAARHIEECDFLLIATGAGFSADSGLPTYADVARNPIYEEKGIEYDDLCRIGCLRSNPSLFYGFWGSCFNAYQQAEPHMGYEILHKWCKQKQFYVYSSNVDGHFRRKEFPCDKLHEMHGNINTWMVLDKDGLAKDCEMLQIPPTFSFPVDSQLEIDPNMLCSWIQNECGIDAGPSYMLRPKVLMFDDGFDAHSAMGLDRSSNAYQSWEEKMELKMASDENLKLVVLEIGCGVKVPSVRRECQDVIADTAAQILDASRCVHIRINPDAYQVEADTNGTVAIGIQGKSLATLRAIDEEIRRTTEST